MANWFQQLSPQQATVFGALVAAISAFVSNLLAGVFRDFVAKIWADDRDRKTAAEKVFQRYAEPLAFAAESLFWRLREAMGGNGRGSYLVAAEPRTEFENYKVISTYYRLGSVLGCLRALHREFSFVRASERWRLQPLEKTIGEFETSLADGHEVEIKRLKGLLKFWDLPSISDGKAEEKLGVAIAQIVKTKLSKSRAQDVLELPYHEQFQLFSQITSLFSKEFDQEISLFFTPDAYQALAKQISIREAWIYRDWQIAIGDMMIKKNQSGSTIFEVIGFGEFEDMFYNPSASQNRNLRRISAIFDGVDLECDDPFDARKKTIEKLYKSTARLIIGLRNNESSKMFVSDELFRAANSSFG